MTFQQSKTLLSKLFDAAILAAAPHGALQGNLPAKPKGRVVVVGAGKGVAQLAAALEDMWDGPISGVVVTRYGYAAPCKVIRVLEASHPVPDQAGVGAASEILKAVSDLGKDDLVIALICGGGSALLPAPPDGFTLEDEQDLNKSLLASGAPIGVMNAIRKHFSQIKGGRLAQAAYPAKVVSLVVSDVPGDDPAQVASGPTVPDAIDGLAAAALVKSYSIDLPPRIAAFISTPSARAPKPDDACFAQNEVKVIASAALSLKAAAQVAAKAGYTPVILSDAIEGEAREIGLMHAAIARHVVQKDTPFAKPVAILSGGETTVTLRGTGKGGRNTEFLLAFARCIAGLSGVVAMAADTDGIDGSEDNAGAFADGTTAPRLLAAGMDPMAILSANDAWSAFDALGDLFVPGPTGTNVNDFRAILISKDAGS
ncbi:glycerate kinase [Sulfitobacter sp. SK011]|uniref:glycerate kinase type-2 family protein n=1 Tax=Sulfitobacter sp. SK011 TaxID=1389004 RepID=UPI000E0AF03F|nr:glycerate kinase [Sulfitobacter sp. SK011]AXI41560.1 glycerate kinase [Sulfitobacter sp. SK011]